MPGEVAQERGGDRVGRTAVGDHVRELAARDLGDVHQRAERGQREKAVALAPEDADRAGVALAEAAQEHRLADPGLAGHQQQPAAGLAGRVERGVERVEVGGPFEQRRSTVGEDESHRSHSLPTPALTAS